MPQPFPVLNSTFGAVDAQGSALHLEVLGDALHFNDGNQVNVLPALRF